jgi:multidrug efflux pump subunit AcrB
MKDWSLKKLLDEVKSEVDSITTFPNEAERPIVREVTRRNRVISLAVYGDASEATIKNLAENIKDEIINLPGITQADLSGVKTGEIHVEISEETLRRYGLTLGKVAEAVRKGSLDLPAGRVKTQGGEILIRTKGRRYYADEYRDVPVLTNPDGSTVTLGQIARLSDGFEDLDLEARFQGKHTALIEVFRVADQNALTVAETIKKFADRLRPTLPEGIEYRYLQ